MIFWYSLIPAMRFRLAAPETLIDINRLADLEYLREEDGHLRIGALTRAAQCPRAPIGGSAREEPGSFVPSIVDDSRPSRKLPG